MKAIHRRLGRDGIDGNQRRRQHHQIMCTITNHLIGDVHVAALGIASPTCNPHSQRLVHKGTNRCSKPCLRHLRVCGRTALARQAFQSPRATFTNANESRSQRAASAYLGARLSGTDRKTGRRRPHGPLSHAVVPLWVFGCRRRMSPDLSGLPQRICCSLGASLLRQMVSRARTCLLVSLAATVRLTSSQSPWRRGRSPQVPFEQEQVGHRQRYERDHQSVIVPVVEGAG